MKAKELAELAMQNNVRFEIYDRSCSVVVASDDSIQKGYLFGLDYILICEVDYIAVVHTEKQPETLQIYTK